MDPSRGFNPSGCNIKHGLATVTVSPAVDPFCTQTLVIPVLGFVSGLGRHTVLLCTERHTFKHFSLFLLKRVESRMFYSVVTQFQTAPIIEFTAGGHFGNLWEGGLFCQRRLWNGV